MSTKIEKILEYLVDLVALAKSFEEGIRDGVRLPDIQDILGGVFLQHDTIGPILLLLESSKEAANRRVHQVHPAGKLHMSSFNGRGCPDDMCGCGVLNVPEGSDGGLAAAASAVGREQANPGGQGVIGKWLEEL